MVWHKSLPDTRVCSLWLFSIFKNHVLRENTENTSNVVRSARCLLDVDIEKIIQALVFESELRSKQ